MEGRGDVVTLAATRFKLLVVDQRGFTLLELLVAVSIFTLVGLGLAASFSTGIKVKRRANRHHARLETANIVLGEIQLNLRNLTPSYDVYFEGSDDELVFVAPVTEWRDGYRNETQLLRHQYQNDTVLDRILKITSEMDGRFPEQSVMAADGAQLRFAFLATADPAGVHTWESTWSGQGFPLAVKIELIFPSDMNSNISTVWTRIARIPIARESDRNG